MAEGGNVRSRDHFHASPFLWSLDPIPFSCNYATAVPAVAGTIVAAELRAGGAYGIVLLELSIFKPLAALNRGAVGFRRGEVFALVRSIPKTAKFRGVEVSDNFAIHKGWGLARDASP